MRQNPNAFCDKTKLPEKIQKDWINERCTSMDRQQEEVRRRDPQAEQIIL